MPANDVTIADVCIRSLCLSGKIQRPLVVAAGESDCRQTGIRLAAWARLRTFDLLLKQRFSFVWLALVEGLVGDAEWRCGWRRPRPPLRTHQDSEQRRDDEGTHSETPERRAAPVWPALAACHRLCHSRLRIRYKLLLRGFQ